LAEAGFPVVEQVVSSTGPGAARALTVLAASEIPVEQKALLVGPLLKLLGDEDPGVRLRTAQALSLLANSRIPDPLKGLMVEPLLGALSDEDQDVRINAADALAELAGADIDSRFKIMMIEPAVEALGDVQQSMVYTTLRPRNAARILFELFRSNIPRREKNRIVDLVTAAQGSDNYEVRFGADVAARLLR